MLNLVEYSDEADIPSTTTDRIAIFNRNTIISFVIPSGLPILRYHLSFSIEVSKNEQIRWRVGIFGSSLSLFLILVLQRPYVFDILGSEKSAILIGVGTSIVTVIITIVTLSKSPLLAKTRVWLGIPLVLSLLVIFFSR